MLQRNNWPTLLVQNLSAHFRSFSKWRRYHRPKEMRQKCNSINLTIASLCSYEGVTTRRRRERSKRSHHRHNSPQVPVEAKTARRHRHHREEFRTGTKHRPAVKEERKDERTPVKVKEFRIISLILG